ncbi:MAG: polymerase, partial [Spirochaetaceae bacterium]|nr:polymerase [Spirochaetaceae bacterium]
MKRLRITAGIALLFLTGTNAGADPRVDLSGGISWERMELTARAALNLDQAGIRLPAGRSHAEELLRGAFPALIQPALLAIPVDSSSTIQDLIDQGEYTLRDIGSLAQEAKRFPPALTPDLASLSAGYTIDITALSASLIRHRRAVDIPRALPASAGGTYTGIIIFADQELPVHGRNSSARVLPCLFPKIWDSDMTLIYQRNMVEPQRAREKG